MKTISLTEFNQNPSKAARLADTDDVVVLRRGQPAYRLTRIEPAGDPIDELLQTGALSPARRTGPRPHRFPSVATDVDLGAALDAERSRLDD